MIAECWKHQRRFGSFRGNYTFEAIEKMEGGVDRYLEGIAERLRNKTYKPLPVRRVYTPKADGSKRPLGMPTIKDRVVQMATKIVIEPNKLLKLVAKRIVDKTYWDLSGCG